MVTPIYFYPFPVSMSIFKKSASAKLNKFGIPPWSILIWRKAVYICFLYGWNIYCRFLCYILILRIPTLLPSRRKLDVVGYCIRVSFPTSVLNLLRKPAYYANDWYECNLAVSQFVMNVCEVAYRAVVFDITCIAFFQ